MKIRLCNDAKREMLLIIEPRADAYLLAPHDEVCAEGEFEVQTDGAFQINYAEDDQRPMIVLWDSTPRSGAKIVVTKNGEALEPRN